MGGLAQIGVPGPSGFVEAGLIFILIVVVWSVLLLAAIALLLTGLVGIRARGGKAKAGVASLVIAVLLWSGYVEFVPPHYTIALDLAASRTPPPGQWHLLYGDEQMLCLQGRVDARIELPEGHTFADQASFVEVDRREGQVVRVFIVTDRLSLDRAYDMASRIIRTWGFDRKNFDQWYKDRKAQKPELNGDDRHFYSYKNGANPGLSLDLRGGNDVWFVELGATWPREGTTQP